MTMVAYRATCALNNDETGLVWHLRESGASDDKTVSYRLAGDMARALCDRANAAYVHQNRLAGTVHMGGATWDLVFERCGYVLTSRATGERVATGNPVPELLRRAISPTELAFGEFAGECSFAMPRIAAPTVPVKADPVDDTEDVQDADDDEGLVPFDLFE